jgi:soluble lytic murein transglycosylase-like protein
MPRRLTAACVTLAISSAVALGASAGGSGSYAQPQPTAASTTGASARHAAALRAQLRRERRAHAAELRRLSHVLRHVYGTDQMVQSALTLASITYGVDRSRLAAISFRESRWRPWAYNPSGASGLFQFMPGTWRGTPQGKAGMSPFDPLAAAMAAAWEVRYGAGWSPWAY